MDLDRLARLKKLVIISLFSDDELMDVLVLKGGNAVDLVYGAALRGSIDLDFSLETDLPRADVEHWQARFEGLLNRTLQSEGYHAFDVKFRAKPPVVSDDMRDFWGGYELEFKIILHSTLEAIADGGRALRVAAETVGYQNRKRFRVDFSRHEFCTPKAEHSLEGYSIYVYTPEMIVCEKLRAICQQTEEYRQAVKSRSGCARAKDFFDIFTLMEHYPIDLGSKEIAELVKAIFQAKRVPLSLLGGIRSQRSFHRPGFEAVEATVKAGVELESYDFYFDYVVKAVDRLQSLWKE